MDAIVDLATLTGACQVALGMKIAGLMGNDDGWIDQVQEAADHVTESVYDEGVAVELGRWFS